MHRWAATQIVPRTRLPSGLRQSKVHFLHGEVKLLGSQFVAGYNNSVHPTLS
jgi:hypothetical protein